MGQPVWDPTKNTWVDSDSGEPTAAPANPFGFGAAYPETKKAPVPVQTIYPRGPENRARGIYPTFRTSIADRLAELRGQGIVPGVAGDVQFLDPTDPKAAAAINDAKIRWMSGQADEQDLALLDAAGVLSPTDIRTYIKSYGGGGGLTASESASLAQRQAEFEYQKQQDRVSNALAILKSIGDQQAQRDARQQAMQSLVAQVTPYAIDPSQQFFAGLGPNDPAVHLGLTPALRTNPVTVRPGLMLQNPWDEQVQAGLAQLRGLAGVA